MKITSSSTSLYTATQVYALDAAAIESGIPGVQLMRRAGSAAYDLLLQRFPLPERITVYCGAGKNGGDGYVLAALAAQRKLSVQVVQLAAPDKLSGEARQAYQFAAQEGVAMVPFAEASAPSEGVIVDALLGIGLQGQVRPEFAAAIAQINQSGLPVLAIDIPSGLNADSGAAQGAVVSATLTITYIGMKRGLLTGRGAALCGEIVLSDLAISSRVYAQVKPACEMLQLPALLNLLAPRQADAHKGDFGHVMIIGGDKGYGGAAILAAEAAARTGAGLVSIATRPEHIPAILARCPEIMAAGVVSGQELEALLGRPRVLVVGPGLGRSPWSEQMLQQAVNSGLPMVLDADALNIIAEGRVVPPSVIASKRLSHNWVLTPHPAEAARLLGISTDAILSDRFASAEKIQQTFSGAVILKGAGSLVVGESGITGIVTQGNPGMASGGMGDILSGIVGGLLAQGLSIENAARLAAVLHANAGDLAADEFGQRSLLATDLIPYLCQLLSD